MLRTEDNTSSITCCYFPGFYTGTNLYCLLTEEQGCEQLDYGCCTAVPKCESNLWPLNRYSDALPVAQPRHPLSLIASMNVEPASI